MPAMLAACLVAAAFPAEGQTAPPERFRVGVGVSVGSGGSPSSTILIPIELTRRVRVEPEIGFSRSSTTETGQMDPRMLVLNPTFQTTTTQKTGSTTAGAGVFFVDARDRFKLHFGGRAGYQRTSFETNAAFGTGIKEDGFFIAPAIGGEYFVFDRFSIGAEVQVRYTSLDGTSETLVTIFGTVSGLPGIPTVLPNTRTRSTSTVATRAAIVARFYIK